LPSVAGLIAKRLRSLQITSPRGHHASERFSSGTVAINAATFDAILLGEITGDSQAADIASKN
jgi:hypothetical protein